VTSPTNRSSGAGSLGRRKRIVTEAAFVRQVLAYYREMGAVVYKLNDGFTVGIPDMPVTWNRNTTWVEAKSTEGYENPVKRVSYDQLQLRQMQKLAQRGRAVYLIWDEGHITFWPPQFLVQRIVVDKYLSWDPDLYSIASLKESNVELIRSLLVGTWDLPILFPEYNLSVLRTLVEV
jgi:hypothetical protein